MQVPDFPIQLCDGLSSMSIKLHFLQSVSLEQYSIIAHKFIKYLSNSAPFISIFTIIYIFIKKLKQSSLCHSDNNIKRSEDVIMLFLFKVSLGLFLMLINPTAPKLILPNGTVIPSEQPKRYKWWPCQKMCDALHYLLDNIFIGFGSNLYRQIVGISNGYYLCSSCCRIFFLFSCERDFMLSLSGNNQTDIIEAFNSTFRYLDDLLIIANPYFEQMVGEIYPTELQ